MLALEVIVMITSFTLLGLIESHAIFSIYPLLVAALSGPVLKEFVGWKRWSAIFIGFIGVMIILKPSNNVFSLEAIIPLVAALMFALYSLLTRYAARQDTSIPEQLLLQIGVSEYLRQIVGGIMMSQGEIFRLSDIGLNTLDLSEFQTEVVQELMSRGNTQDARTLLVDNMLEHSANVTVGDKHDILPPNHCPENSTGHEIFEL